VLWPAIVGISPSFAFRIPRSPGGDLEAIEQALHEGGNPDCRDQRLAGLNAFFQTVETGSPAVMDLIARWILDR
jgi:hypothetical protein